jgi:hypothetical protein
VSQPFQTLQNGYQIVSDGKSVREVFGSLAKERDFRTLEIRTQHRSEYRKLILQGEAAQPSRTAGMPFGSAHAATIYHAGQFLTALAALNSSQLNPSPGPSQTDRLRGRQVDPFPWPWQTDPPYPWPYPWWRS